MAQRTADSPIGPAAAGPLAERPVSGLRGVGPALAATLERLGIRAVQDLLFHLPLRYEDRTHVVPIGSLRPGARAVVEGEIQLAEVVFRRRRALLCRIADGSGFLTLRFFHFSNAQHGTLVRGTRLRCFGEVRAGPGGLEIVHPEYRRLLQADGDASEPTLTPFYPGTEGLQQGRLRGLIAQALRALEDDPLPDVLPRERIANLHLPTLGEALRYVHAPPADARLDELLAGRHPSQRRLAFEELLAHQLSLRMLRRAADADPSWPLPPPDGASKVAELRAGLPFALTGAQARAWAEIEHDLARPQPMMRLRAGRRRLGQDRGRCTRCAARRRPRRAGCGDGADRAARRAARAQLRRLARSARRAGGAALRPPRQARRASARSPNSAVGEAAVAIGTHALFQEGVEFARLGLVIVDEQHRFGVHQRLALREKGAGAGRAPHQLVMTATPIPRTLAMTVYADLDVSVIDELPPGRTPIAHGRAQRVAPRRGRRAHRCRLRRGPPGLLGLPADRGVRGTAAPGRRGDRGGAGRGAATAPRRTRARAHAGRARRTRSWRRFKAGEIDLLVATTVIEVGVDVPNASLMIIENAGADGPRATPPVARTGRARRRGEQLRAAVPRPPLAPLARERLEPAAPDQRRLRDRAQRTSSCAAPARCWARARPGCSRCASRTWCATRNCCRRSRRSPTRCSRARPIPSLTLLRRWIGEGERFARA